MYWSPPPLELIQLPAKKYSLTTYKGKKILIAGRQPGFSPTHGCISVFARVSSNLFLLPQSLMPNVQLSKRVNFLFPPDRATGKQASCCRSFPKVPGDLLANQLYGDRRQP